MIQITHFVNPHLFFFKWKKDDGVEKPFQDMENKLHGTVTNRSKKRASDEHENETIEIGDIVAAYVPYWNKWVRGQMKEKYQNGLFSVWAVDYGVPMVSKPSDVFKPKPMYARMNINCPRIQLGGLINCVPAEYEYDFEQNCNMLVEQSNWTKKAMGIAVTAIERAVQFKFDNSREFQVANRSHRFGRLTLQKSDGSWLDFDECLIKAQVAKLTTDNWLVRINRLESIQQPEWKTVDGVPLRVICQISTITNDIDDSQENGQSIDKTISTANENPVGTKDSNNSNNEVASSNMQPPRPLMKPNAMKNNRGRSNTRMMTPNGQRPRQYSRSEFPPGWHSNGKLNNQRYREEVEYFEAAFRKPTTPVGKDSSSDDSMDGSSEKQTNDSESKGKEQGDIESKEQNVNEDIATNNGTTDEKAININQDETKPAQEQAKTTFNDTVNNHELNEAENAVAKIQLDGKETNVISDSQDADGLTQPNKDTD